MKRHLLRSVQSFPLQLVSIVPFALPIFAGARDRKTVASDRKVAENLRKIGLRTSGIDAGWTVRSPKPSLTTSCSSAREDIDPYFGWLEA